MKNSKYPCPQDPTEAAIVRWWTYKENEEEK